MKEIVRRKSKTLKWKNKNNVNVNIEDNSDQSTHLSVVFTTKTKYINFSRFFDQTQKLKYLIHWGQINKLIKREALKCGFEPLIYDLEYPDLVIRSKDSKFMNLTLDILVKKPIGVNWINQLDKNIINDFTQKVANIINERNNQLSIV